MHMRLIHRNSDVILSMYCERKDIVGSVFFEQTVSFNIVIALLSFLWSTRPKKLSASNMLSLAVMFFPNEESFYFAGSQLTILM